MVIPGHNLGNSQVSINRTIGPSLVLTFFPTSQGGSTQNSVLIGQAVSEKKMFENNGHIHVFSPRAGADNTLWHLFLKHNYSVN